MLGVVLLPQGRSAAAQAPTSPAVQAHAVDGSARLTQARADFERGRAAYADGHLEQARAAWRAAFALLPSSELAYDLGLVCERLGQTDEALHYLRYARAHTGAGARGGAERKQLQVRIDALQRHHDARSAMLKLTPPTSAEVLAEARRFFELGVRLFGRKQYEGALAAFAAALGLSPLPALHYNLALTSERLGRLQDAMDHYRSYVRLSPEAPDRAIVEARLAQLARAAPR